MPRNGQNPSGKCQPRTYWSNGKCTGRHYCSSYDRIKRKPLAAPDAGIIGADARMDSLPAA